MALIKRQFAAVWNMPYGQPGFSCHGYLAAPVVMVASEDPSEAAGSVTLAYGR